MSKYKSTEKLYLIFVSKIGEIYDGENIYEFIFSDNPDDANGEKWEMSCWGNVEPPNECFIDAIYNAHITDFELSLLEEQDSFRYLDGVLVDIPLAWEYVEDYRELPSLNNKLLSFKFAEPFDSVKEKLESKNVTFIPSMKEFN